MLTPSVGVTGDSVVSTQRGAVAASHEGDAEAQQRAPRRER
jgi:hypothetical protein